MIRLHSLPRLVRNLAMILLLIAGMSWLSSDWTHEEHSFAEDRPAEVGSKVETSPSTKGKDSSEASQQEPPAGTRRSKKRDRSAKPLAQSRPYPVFGIDEVLDHLATTGARLHKSGKAKGDVELRKQLDRKACPVRLAPSEETSVSDRDLYRRACDSVFLVCSLYRSDDPENWQTSLATAFVVAEEGILSTSCHVFDNEDNADVVLVMDVRKNVYPVVELLASNKLTDTCLFRIDAKNLKPLPLAEDALPGTTARIVAHPGDSFFFFSSGHVANYERDQDNVLWMNVTADFGQGSSGGPVFNEFGQVIGQVSRTYTLYSGSASTRSRPQRIAGKKTLAPRRSLAQRDGTSVTAASKDGKPKSDEEPEEEEMVDPQMVFKSCVPIQSLRSLIAPDAAEK
jgi:serine protease Do